MKIYEHLNKTVLEKGAAWLVLIDPDKVIDDRFQEFILKCVEADVDGFLIGGSLMIKNTLDESISKIKEVTKLPVVIFPGSVSQVSSIADGILYISLISGRNADQLIGKHVLAAPMVKAAGIEVLSTGYMLVDSGKRTTAEYMSNSQPLPRNKPEIAAATALAGEYLGMSMIYLEAGSGADNPVPDEMVKMVSEYCSVPLIVGGGIRDAETAASKVGSGANIIVTGNYFEDVDNWNKLKEFSKAIHHKIDY